jgi:hypothetical protein
MRVLAPMGIAIDADLARTLTAGDATPAQSDRLTVRAVRGF